MAKLLEPTISNIQLACDHLNNNGVVVFPTETVYGIGASAFSQQGIDEIYRIKCRPSNNPLIMHVESFVMAKQYWDLNEIESSIIDKLSIFMPGPLTILAKRNKKIPICFENELIGIRVPDDKTARNLIHKLNKPIFAPSANKSGFVTSTTSEHVINYFKFENDLIILNSDKPSKYGIESTIIKIQDNNVSIVRPGYILKEDIEAILGFDIQYSPITSQSEHPGSSIDHYKIRAKTKMFNFVINDPNEFSDVYFQQYTTKYLAESLIIDFNSKNKHLIDLFLGYVDLSQDGDPKEALYNLYNVLHTINSHREVKNVLIFDSYSNKDGYFKAIFDRFYRCAQGQYLVIPIPQQLFQCQESA